MTAVPATPAGTPTQSREQVADDIVLQLVNDKLLRDEDAQTLLNKRVAYLIPGDKQGYAETLVKAAGIHYTFEDICEMLEAKLEILGNMKLPKTLIGKKIEDVTVVLQEAREASSSSNKETSNEYFSFKRIVRKIQTLQLGPLIFDTEKKDIEVSVMIEDKFNRLVLCHVVNLAEMQLDCTDNIRLQKLTAAKGKKDAPESRSRKYNRRKNTNSPADVAKEIFDSNTLHLSSNECKEKYKKLPNLKKAGAVILSNQLLIFESFLRNIVYKNITKLEAYNDNTLFLEKINELSELDKLNLYSLDVNSLQQLFKDLGDIEKVISNHIDNIRMRNYYLMSLRKFASVSSGIIPFAIEKLEAKSPDINLFIKAVDECKTTNEINQFHHQMAEKIWADVIDPRTPKEKSQTPFLYSLLHHSLWSIENEYPLEELESMSELLDMTCSFKSKVQNEIYLQTRETWMHSQMEFAARMQAARQPQVSEGAANQEQEIEDPQTHEIVETNFTDTIQAVLTSFLAEQKSLSNPAAKGSMRSSYAHLLNLMTLISHMETSVPSNQSYTISLIALSEANLLLEQLLSSLIRECQPDEQMEGICKSHNLLTKMEALGKLEEYSWIGGYAEILAGINKASLSARYPSKVTGANTKRPVDQIILGLSQTANETATSEMTTLALQDLLQNVLELTHKLVSNNPSGRLPYQINLDMEDPAHSTNPEETVLHTIQENIQNLPLSDQKTPLEVIARMNGLIRFYKADKTSKETDHIYYSHMHEMMIFLLEDVLKQLAQDEFSDDEHDLMKVISSIHKFNMQDLSEEECSFLVEAKSTLYKVRYSNLDQKEAENSVAALHKTTEHYFLDKILNGNHSDSEDFTPVINSDQHENSKLLENSDMAISSVKSSLVMAEDIIKKLVAVFES